AFRLASRPISSATPSSSAMVRPRRTVGQIDVLLLLPNSARISLLTVECGSLSHWTSHASLVCCGWDWTHAATRTGGSLVRDNGGLAWAAAAIRESPRQYNSVKAHCADDSFRKPAGTGASFVVSGS